MFKLVLLFDVFTFLFYAVNIYYLSDFGLPFCVVYLIVTFIFFYTVMDF